MSKGDQQIWSTSDALAMACAIHRQRGFTSSSTVVFGEPFNEDRWTNKDHLCYQLKPEIAGLTYISQFSITDGDRETAATIIAHFRRLSFGVLGGDINDYMRRVFAVTQNDTVTFGDLGVLASVPNAYERDMAAKRLTAQIKDTRQEYLGEIGKTITVTLRYLTVRYVPRLNCFSHEAVADSGHLVSFLNSTQLGKTDQQQTVKGRVKRHGVNYTAKTLETQINYVKVIDTISELQYNN